MKFVSITPENVSNYKDLIIRERMPAFVKIYRPSCWHCQQMQGAWDNLDSEDELKNMDIAIIELRSDALDSIDDQE